MELDLDALDALAAAPGDLVIVELDPVNWVRHMYTICKLLPRGWRLMFGRGPPCVDQHRVVPSVAVLAQDAINATDAEATGHTGDLGA